MSPKAVVFKKISRDKSVGVYMAKRDFVDRCDSVDPVANKSESDDMVFEEFKRVCLKGFFADVDESPTEA